MSFAQTSKIEGKLVLSNDQYSREVKDNTYVILKSKSINDSVKVGKHLEFVIENLRADTIRLHVSPRTYPTEQTFTVRIKDGETAILNLPYSPVCPYKIEKTACPKCLKVDNVIPISYGFLVQIIDKKNKNKQTPKSHSGGCVVRECQPNWYCEKDSLEF
jgi:hypothetical protein